MEAMVVQSAGAGGGRERAPCCPRCGYDQSGAIAAWLDRCPLESRCSECGAGWPSRELFVQEPGPAWSVEHGSRGLVRRWLLTTLIALRPGKLWRELRPEHPVSGRRLAWMAASWVIILHLIVAAIVGISAGGVISRGASPLGSWRDWDLRSWATWAAAGRSLVWPYDGWISVPTSANSASTNPIAEFVLNAVVPQVAMAALVLVWARPLRTKRVSRWHLTRAVVLSLPVAAAWTVLGSAAFVGACVSDDWCSLLVVPEACWLGSIFGLLATVIWWWRCFVVEYLGERKRQWMMGVLGVGAFVVTWAVFAGCIQVVRVLGGRL